MKTVVLLSALVSITLAAPALQGEGFEDTQHVPDWPIQAHPSIPETVKREKKSVTELSSGPTFHPGVPNNEVHNDASSLTGRSFALKKPLIVKKKYGYRLYRDSEEEKANADSHESCGRQVKVKLCDEDGKFREMLRSSGHDISNVHSSDDDMKLSIKMAKDAVENLQRDLMKMEQRDSAMKIEHNSESDTDLHADIEVARQALEHIHTNFGNLETMSLHATASRDSEAMHDVHITLAKSEEERMAQWKEAMENIQTNVEIIKNIEDSFKSANHQENQLVSDQFESDSTTHVHKRKEEIASHVVLNEEHHMRDAETSHLKTQSVEKQKGEEGPLDKATIDHLNEHHAREELHLDDDMNPSASEAIEMKTIDIQNHHTLRSENHKHHEEEKSVEGKLEELGTEFHNKAIETNDKTQDHHQLPKNTETDLNMAAPIDTMKHQQLLSIKEAEQMETKLDADKDTSFKTSENVADTHKASSTDSIKSLTPEMIKDHQRSTEEKELGDKSEHHSNHEKALDGTEILTGLHSKSAEHVDSDKKEKIKEETKFNVVTGKSAEKLIPELNDQHTETFETKPKEANQSPLLETLNKEKKDHTSKAVQEIHLNKLHNIAEQNENLMRAAEHILQEPHAYHKIDYNDSEHLATLTGMKSAEEHLHHHITALKPTDDHMHHHLAAMKAAENHLHHPEAHWAHEHKHVTSMKAAEDFNNDFHGFDHMRNSHLPEHQYIPNKMGATHDFEMSEHTHHLAHAPARYHHNVMSHSKMHEMNALSGGAMPSNFHPSMREAMDGFGSEHTYRWMPSHESARNAYGAGLSGPSGGGAVGVFPNANTGGCGIPLLLSCSPSVVSGSLAKAHSSYGGSSYRSEDDFGFHNKRDIKKTNDIRSTNALRSPAIVKQKTGSILEKL